MSTVAFILEEAFREGGLTTELQHPTPTQTEQALARLQTVIASAYGFEVGEQLEDWRVGNENVRDTDATWSADHWTYPVPNSRLLLMHDSAQTIYLPEPTHGSRISVVDVNGALAAHNVTLNGNGRHIENASSLVLSANNYAGTWLYDADSANWALVTPILKTSSMPFPAEFDEYFITSLAMRLNPRYGRGISEVTAAALQRSLEKMRARYEQRQDVGVALGARAVTTGYQDGRFARPAGSGRYGWMH